MELISSVSIIQSFEFDDGKASFTIILYDTLEAPTLEKPVLVLVLSGCENLESKLKEAATLKEQALWGIEATKLEECQRIDFYDEFGLAFSIFCECYDRKYRQFGRNEWASLVSSFESHVTRQNNQICSLKNSIANLNTKISRRIEKQSLAIAQTDEGSALNKRAKVKLEIYLEIRNIIENETSKKA